MQHRKKSGGLVQRAAGWIIPLVVLLPLLVIGSDKIHAADMPLTGTARVIDGDTLDVGEQRIRLHGIDAPESKQTCRDQSRDYPCGKDATDHLKSLIAGRMVHCESKTTDRYRRIIAVCFTADGRDLNQAMVRAGMALAYRRYSMDYVMDENHAQSAGLGLWRGAFTPPWQWRKRKRT